MTKQIVTNAMLLWQYFKTHDVHSGRETLSPTGPNIWLTVPMNINDSQSSKDFKNKTKG